MSIQKLVFLFLGLAVASTAWAQKDPAQTAWIESYEPFTRENMPYRLMKPLGYDANKLYPVIVSLHGGGGRGNDNLKQLKVWNQQLAQRELREKFPTYVLAPQSDHLWDADHLAKLKPSSLIFLPLIPTESICWDTPWVGMEPIS